MEEDTFGEVEFGDEVEFDGEVEFDDEVELCDVEADGRTWVCDTWLNQAGRLSRRYA